ncbi:unnamed protein product [Zymoseptoria tritici ST99CH_3D7]|uniref:Myb-like domain-containing protein n=1 Tax=Zymoseptoria tritici (strain ST99CH_3D7) TaxID=1276538 RepID=A0A1X7RLF4_ZYMT9|nr:unnamed protein product [Zymoseptoria tritici ST99CH_3D7]
MATPPEQPWTIHEKNYLLAEIIKGAYPTPDVLLNLVRNMNVKPRWDDIPLPLGRSLNSCKAVYEDLWRSHSMQSMAMPYTPTPLSAPMPPHKRPYQFEGSYSAGPSNREIRPRPAVVAGGAYSQQPSPNEPPPKRKRGRPTKAEAQAKAEAAAAMSGGDPGSATTSRSATQAAATFPPPPNTAASMRTEELKPPTTVAARMPIAAMLTPNPREKSSSHSGSSSGKRRRARSTKAEQDEFGTSREGGGQGGPRYESPYGRPGPEADDPPARTAVLRHREGHPDLLRVASPHPTSTTSGAPPSFHTHGQPRPR